MYTSLNQYYVVMEVAPQFWQSPAGSQRHLRALRPAVEKSRLSAVTQYQPTTAPLP